MARLVAAGLLLALVLVHTAQGVTIAEFLVEDKYKPFLLKASQAGVCLNDPSVTSGRFDLDLCPSLLQMLDALYAGATEYPVDCEPVCAENFYSLTPDCLAGLTEQFNFDTQPIGILGSRFLEICAEVISGAGAPSPAPGPGPATAPAPSGAPSPV